jgi:hypothetical protein
MRQQPLLDIGQWATVEVLLETVSSVSATSRWYRLTDRVQFMHCSAVEWSGASWMVSEWFIGLLRLSPCELLVVEAGSWGMGITWEPRVRGTCVIQMRYQTTTAEDTADWEDLVRGLSKRYRTYFFPEKPVMAGWQILLQWWGGPSCTCMIFCGLARCIFLS